MKPEGYSKRVFNQETPIFTRSKRIRLEEMSSSSSDSDWDFNDGFIIPDSDEASEDSCDSYLEKLTAEERDELNRIEAILKKINQDDIPMKIKILQLEAPISVKAKILHKYEYMSSIEPSSSEFGKIKNWVEFMLNIPWGNHVEIPMTLSDGSWKITNYLRTVKEHLDTTLYGQHEPKSAILEMLAQWISNPSAPGWVLGFEGPPGTGKTSLMRHGVAWALQRPFVSISLGGSVGGSLLEGSNQVYEGSSCGRVVQSLVETKCMNPIFYMDELDKLSKSSQGHEIANVLVHLTDPSQNYDFQDKFLETGFNLSRAVFIFSYNQAELIDPILKDRIKQISFHGYTLQDKIQIALEHSFPNILKAWGFKTGDVILTPQVIEYIVVRYTCEESGIRSLIHYLETLVSKLNLLRITDSLELEYQIDVEFPLILTINIVDHLLFNFVKVESLNRAVQ